MAPIWVLTPGPGVFAGRRWRSQSVCNGGNAGISIPMLAVDKLIAAPASAAWDVLVDLDVWPKWGPTVSEARLDPPYTALALRVTGTVRTALGFAVPFVVTEFEPGRHWAWKVAGVPATHHTVESVGDSARVTIAVPWWAAAYLTVCSIALHRIDAMLSAAP